MREVMVEALEAAKSAWEECVHMSNKSRLETARHLNRHGVFGAPQLAAITHMHETTMRNYGLGKGVRGGRFNPSACSTLILLGKQFMLNEEINVALMRLAVESGCSCSTIAYYTGIPEGRLYRLWRK